MQIDNSCNSKHVAATNFSLDSTLGVASSSPGVNPTQQTPPVVFTVSQLTGQHPGTTGQNPQLVKVVQAADGSGTQLIKVLQTTAASSPGGDQVPLQNTNTTYTISDCLSQMASPAATTTVYQNAVVQRVEDGQPPSGDGVVSQRVFNLVQKPLTTQQQSQKPVFNNGQQRVQTVTALPTNARVVPGCGTSTGPKVQILSNVVVSKQNIVLNKTNLQPQRQIMTSLTTPKQLNLNNNQFKPQSAIKQQPLLTTTKAQQPVVNNMVYQQKPVITNQKTIKTVGGTRVTVSQPQKTIKTLSPQSPNYSVKTTGIKTLSPQPPVNHYTKLQSPVKMQPQVTNRVGIKTLAPQRLVTQRAPNHLPAKPNYIGKHAVQAQKSNQKSAQQPVGKTRTVGNQQRLANQAMSPTKYAAKQSGNNAQSSFNQSLTAQILQSLPSTGGRNVTAAELGYLATKNYPMKSPPDDQTLSEDIGEEVRPDFSPNLSYLYQVVMLDHNYGAPPPALSPPIARLPIPQLPPSSMNGTVPQQSTANYYGAASGKRLNRLQNQPPAQIQHQPQNPIQTHHQPLSTSLGVAGVLSATAALETRSGAADDDAASTISSDGGRLEDGDEGEETETAPEGEGDEDGITRCICDFDHDDGYMICCDVCSSWQHVDCMGLDRDHIPEKYSCVRCEPRRVDRQLARAIQQRKRDEFARIGGTVGAVVVGGPPVSGGANSGSVSDSSSETSTAESTGDGPHHGSGANSRNQPVTLNNNLVGKKRGAPVSLSTRRKSEPARRAPLTHKRQQRRESTRETSVASRRSAALKKREKKQVMKRKMKSRSSIDDDSQDSWPSATVVTPPAYPTNSVSPSMIQLRQWIDHYEEAVTNHYSPELRARISNVRVNGTPNSAELDKQAPPNAQQEVAIPKCKVVNQPLTQFKIVMATQTLQPNAAVIELRGKYMLSTQHRTAGAGPPGSGGLLTRQHSQRPGPFLFFYRLPRDGTEVCVDTRTYGNDARFIRRSCRPTAELRHCIEKGALHLYVITLCNIDKNNEITIKHESHDLAAAAASTTTGPPVSIACACGNPQQCALFTNHRKNGGTIHETVPSTTNLTNSNNAATTTTPSTQESSTTHRKKRGRRASSPLRPESPPPAPQESLPSPVATQAPPAPPPALSTRRASSHNSRAASSGRESLDRAEEPHTKVEKVTTSPKEKGKKMTREERKMEAIMKAFERLEKNQQRKQEQSARQAQRRESDPIPTTTQPQHNTRNQENGEIEREGVRTKRKKRKGRARTVSTTSQSSTRRRTRLNSTDSYATSGDESPLLSPPLPITTSQEIVVTRPTTPEPPKSETSSPEINVPIEEMSPAKISDSQASDLSSPGQVNTAAGLLLALANGGNSNEPNCNKSPEVDGNSSGSNSSLQSSPSTPLSSACLLVQAAVGPLEPGFKFPKTKKAIMNEWLNKSPEPLQASHHSNFQTEPLDLNISHHNHPTNTDYYSNLNTNLNNNNNSSSLMLNTANKGLATLVQAASLCDSPPQSVTNKVGIGGVGMSGQGAGNAKKRWLRQAISEECDSPCSRPESPPCPTEMVAPPKKRRLARESLSSEQSFTPPTTPTMLVPPSNSLVEEDYPNQDEEFYTTEERTTSNSSPPDSTDFQKPSILKDPVAQRLELMYAGHLHQDATDTDDLSLRHPGLESEAALKERVVEMQLEFESVKREELLDTLAQKFPDTLPSTLLDPRLGRERPLFRDSAQLLGTVEKTIRFYEENLTGPVPQSIPEKITSPPPPPKIQSPIQVPQIQQPIIIQQPTLIQQPTIIQQPIIIQQPTIIQQPIIIQPPTIASIQLPPVSQPPISSIQHPPIPLPHTQQIVLQQPYLQLPSIQQPLIQPAIQPTIHPPIQLPIQPPVQLTIQPPIPPPIQPPLPPPIQVTFIEDLPVPSTIKPQGKPEMVTPAKRKLSISEYRQRKQLTTTCERSSSPERPNSPETPPPSGSRSTGAPGLRTRSDSTSSTTSSLSSDEEMDGVAPVEVKPPISEPQVLVAFNSAPTAVELQRENVDRIKRAFGLALDDENRRRDILSPKSLLNSPTIVPSSTVPSSTALTSQPITTPEPTKFLASPDLTLAASKYVDTQKPSAAKRMRSSPDLFKKLAPIPKSPRVTVVEEVQSNVADDIQIEVREDAHEDYNLHKQYEVKEDCEKEEQDDDPRFDEDSFIPPFNNPVYPNSTQFTSFASVIDTSPYEGRNPSPPPSELLTTSKQFDLNSNSD